MIANLGQYVKLVHIFYQLILLFKEVKGRISFKDFQGIAIPPTISIPDCQSVFNFKISKLQLRSKYDDDGNNNDDYDAAD